MGTKYLQPYMHGFFMDWSWQRSMSRTNECFPRSDSEVCCKLSDVRIIGSMPSWRLLSTPLRLRSTGSRRPQRRKQLQKHMSHEKNLNIVLSRVATAKVKLLRERSRKLMLWFCFFFTTRGPMFANLWTRGNTRRWLYTIPTHSERTAKEPRFAKGPRKMQWAKSTSLPAKSPCF